MHRDDVAETGISARGVALIAAAASVLAFALALSTRLASLGEAILFAFAFGLTVLAVFGFFWLITYQAYPVAVPEDGRAEWGLSEVKVYTRHARRWTDHVYSYDAKLLSRSLLLRMTLRERFGLTLDLGADSPEILRSGDPPIAEWQTVSALPEPVDGARTSSAYRTNAAGPSVLREPFDERAGRLLRKTANSFTTVVDEAALDDERLYVREGKDVASMDLSLLRGAAPLGDGHVVFSFGKFTSVVFPAASASHVVRALRERIPRNTLPPPLEAAEDEVEALGREREAARSGRA